jgi:HEAT repeat protein
MDRSSCCSWLPDMKDTIYAQCADIFKAADFDELADRLVGDDIEIRRLALIEIADEADENHLPIIVAACRDAAPFVRAEAARLLAGWESTQALDAVLRLLLDDDDAVRDSAAQTLAEIKTQAAGLQILPWADHEVVFVRVAVLRALRELRLPEAAAPALRALSHAAAEVRREGVGILGWLKYEAALRELATTAIDDADTEVRRAAVGALGMARDANVLPALLRALTDSAWNVREEAVATLGKLKLSAATSALISTLRDDYWQVGLRAARALGQIGSPQAVPSLIEMLRHSLSNVRKEAAIALGEIGDVASVIALDAAQEDTDPDVRKAARFAVAKIKSKANAS